MLSSVLADMVLIIGCMQVDAFAQTTVAIAASNEVPRLTVGGTVAFGTVLGRGDSLRLVWLCRSI
jgi:hypothetical protein